MDLASRVPTPADADGVHDATDGDQAVPVNEGALTGDGDAAPRQVDAAAMEIDAADVATTGQRSMQSPGPSMMLSHMECADVSGGAADEGGIADATEAVTATATATATVKAKAKSKARRTGTDKAKARAKPKPKPKAKAKSKGKGKAKGEAGAAAAEDEDEVEGESGGEVEDEDDAAEDRQGEEKSKGKSMGRGKSKAKAGAGAASEPKAKKPKREPKPKAPPKPKEPTRPSRPPSLTDGTFANAACSTTFSIPTVLRRKNIGAGLELSLLVPDQSELEAQHGANAWPRQNSSRKPPSRIYLIDRHEPTVKLGGLRKDSLVACCRNGADAAFGVGIGVGTRPLPPLLPHQRRGESRQGRFDIMKVVEPTSKTSKSVILAYTKPEGRDELVNDYGVLRLSVEPGTQAHRGLLPIMGVVHAHKLEPVPPPPPPPLPPP